MSDRHNNGPQPSLDRESDAQVKLQILATEHWSLLASRALAWNESFSRATMFLAVLSGAVVALALVAQATAFGDGFNQFALVILPVVLFVGLTTVARMGDANYHDAMCVIGMNRIRHAYLEIAPDIEPYLVMSPHDDQLGMKVTMAVQPHSSFFRRYVSATPSVVATINSIIAGVIGFAAGSLLNLKTPAKAIAALAAFALLVYLQQFWAMRDIRNALAGHDPIFPSNPEVPA